MRSDRSNFQYRWLLYMSSLCSASSEQVVIVVGLLLVQVTWGAYAVVLSGLIGAGLDPIFVIVTGNLATFFLLVPFAFTLERSKWPEKLRFGLMVKFLLVSIGGITLYQPLLLFGMEKTTPTISSSMSNISPGIIFLVAACLRLEKFNIMCKYSLMKITGILMCLIGVLLVSMLQTSPTSPASSSSSYDNPNWDWIIGCIALFVAIFMMSCSQILQAVVMKEFPAPISLCAIVFFIGTILIATIQIIAEGKLDVGSSSISTSMFIVYCFMIGVVTGGCISFQTWSISKRGPVLVSMFNPISTITAAVLSAFIWGKFISLGSLVGIAIMFVGLYLFLWSKNKESSSIESVDGSCGGELVVEIEKPLLN